MIVEIAIVEVGELSLLISPASSHRGCPILRTFCEGWDSSTSFSEPSPEKRIEKLRYLLLASPLRPRSRTRLLPIQPRNFPAELILRHLGLKSLRAKEWSVSLFPGLPCYVARRERVDFRSVPPGQSPELDLQETRVGKLRRYKTWQQKTVLYLLPNR